ncbi:MAG: DUF86 domain-containing protein [Polaromonas sp.]
MRNEDAVRIRHMRDAAQSAITFMQGHSLAELSDNLMLQFAVMKAVKILGEASTQISAPGQHEAPHISLSVTKGMRNRLVHAYFDLNVNILYATVKEALPPFLVQLQTIDLQNE